MAEHRTRARTTRRSGVAVVEMAIVLPLLLTLALACTDLGRVIHVYITLCNANRCGAEYGSRHNFSDFTQATREAEVRQIIREEMEGLNNFDSGNLVTTIVTSVDADGLRE